MKLSLKVYISFSNKQLKIIETLSYHTNKLYNIANYQNREGSYKNYYNMEKLLKSNWHSEYLHSHTYQHCLKILDENWKSFFSLNKNYKINPHKYKGVPKPPRYKNKIKKNEIVFTNLAIRSEGKTLKLSLSKKIQLMFNVKSLNLKLNDKVLEQVNINNIQQVRIKWDNVNKQWYLILIHEKPETTINSNFSNIMSIDIGLNNLAAVTFLENNNSYIIDGKTLKSKNSYFNDKIAKLTSIEMKKSKDSNKFKRTKKLKQLQRKRNNYVNDYIHKVSKKLIDLALENKCNTIVVGDIKNIKYDMNYNKNFIQIPLSRLVKLIEYKAKLIGITVVKVKESYTSGVSAIDLEKINKSNYKPKRRIKRGLFITNQGIGVNSDINGSLNILRKYTKVIPDLIEKARANGYVANPLQIRVA